MARESSPVVAPGVRHRAYLRQRYRIIVGFGGLLVLIAGGIILSPLPLLAAYPQEAGTALAFLLPGGLLAAAGFAAWRLLAAEKAVSLTWQEGGVALVAAWLLAIGVGAIPFVAVGGLSPARALFESTVGWTAAGPSILDVDQAAHLLLFYRSVTQFAGGTGFAIIALGAMGASAGPGLAMAEGREEQILPNVRSSARLVLTIYAGYAVVGILGLRVAGMSWFDALSHALATLSTGGSGTHSASIGHWQNPAVEAVSVVLMVLGMLNFSTAYALLRGQLRALRYNSQLRAMATLLVVGTLILLVSLEPESAAGAALQPVDRLRLALFHAVSALSTTGLSTIDAGQWNELGRLVLWVLMIVGGGAGSTAGGIKLYRVYVLYKGVVWQVRRALLPMRAVSEPDLWEGQERRLVATDQVRDAALFACLYLTTLVVTSGVLVAHGYALGDSLFEMASAMSGVGLSTGITTPNMPAGVLWTEMAGMFLGRLEFLVVIVGIARVVQDVPIMARRRP